MRDLRAAVTNPGACTWVEFPHAGHMDAYELARTEYWPAVAEFFDSHGLGVASDAFDQDGINEDVMGQVCVQAQFSSFMSTTYPCTRHIWFS